MSRLKVSTMSDFSTSSKTCLPSGPTPGLPSAPVLGWTTCLDFSETPYSLTLQAACTPGLWESWSMSLKQPAVGVPVPASHTTVDLVPAQLLFLVISSTPPELTHGS